MMYLFLDISDGLNIRRIRDTARLQSGPDILKQVRYLSIYFKIDYKAEK